jgi:hypothetical protein
MAANTGEVGMADVFKLPSDAAWALLVACREGRVILTRKAASFVGETLADDAPLSEKQTAWLQALLTKAGLPPLKTREVRDGQL